jgi:preprotein translocase subunit YajC
MPKIALSSAHDFLAQAAAPAAGAGAGPAGPGGSTMLMLLVYGLMFAAMYFFLIAPQNKKRKEHEKLIAGLESGDEIISTGGIFGVVTAVKEDRLVVRVAESTKIELGKSFLQAVVRKANADKK